jgi:lysophospholipase L1-like esterase
MERLTITRRTWVLAASFLTIVGLLYLWFRGGGTDYMNLPPSARGPWVAFGDSLTEGYGASEGQSYPAVLSRALGFPIVNAGRSGDTTATALQRLDEVARLNPRVALVCLGGNDTLNGESRSQMISNLGAIIDRFQQEGTFVVLIGIRSASLRDKQEQLFRELAESKRVLYVRDMLRGVAFKPVYMSDAIHPNDAGYQRIAERIEKALRPVLGDIKPGETTR